ncbi:MAG: penicillin-binding protein activator LpoB [Bacteroidales bacterium]
MYKFFQHSVTILIIVILGGCFSQRKVERVSPDEQIDLSGRWNDTDSRLTAEAMTAQMLGGRWIEEFERSQGKRPVMIVGLIRNKSHEHIDAETFIKDIERSVINNGSVRIVQAGDKREELRRERADQQEFASMETAKNWGLELGADYMLQGTINSIVDEYRRDKTVTYMIGLELTNLETNEVAWMGDKKIKKFIKD